MPVLDGKVAVIAGGSSGVGHRHRARWFATRCRVRHSWLARVPAANDETRAGYDAIFSAVHAAVRDEDFVMLPQCGEGVRQGQHDHMLIGRNKIGVEHMIKVFARELGVALG